MNLFGTKVAVATAVMALAIGGAMSPAAARDRGHGGGFHGGGFHGGGFHGGGFAGRGFQGGGFHGGRNFAQAGGWRHGGFARHGWSGGYHRSYPGRYAGGWSNPGYVYSPGYYGGYGYDGLGLGFTAGLIGGALLGAETPYVGSTSSDSVAYCEARFKSYNPATGTYLGYDGKRHSCP